MHIFSGYEHLIGGFAGGVASTIACHPFDLLKIRYSANEGSSIRPQYTSYAHAVRSIVRVNGVRGLYQGLSPAIIGAPVSWGLYFHLFQRVRNNVNFFSSYPFFDNLIAGSLTGSFVLLLTNPIWVCKTRMCLQYENSTKSYDGLVDCLRKIYRREGIHGFYKGFIPGLLGSANGAIQFAFYNYMKDWQCMRLKLARDSKLDTSAYLLFSMMSKIASTMVTFPYQVLRTRLQDEHVAYKGVADCVTKTLKNEGVSGLYKGMWMATVKQMPNSVVTYVVYEHTRHFLENL